MTDKASNTTPYHAPRPRRFAPLNPAYPNTHSAPPLKGIIFDVDGTLCLPQNHMFREMRAALNIPKSIDILEHIRALSDEPEPEPEPEPNPLSPPSPSAQPSTPSAFPTSTTSPPTLPPPTQPQPHPSTPRSRATAAIQSIERSTMTHQTPQPGLNQLMKYLTSKSIPKALCTRNFPAPVHHLLEKFLVGEVFDPVITRETVGVRPKPSPEGIWWIARAWGLEHGDGDGDGGGWLGSGSGAGSGPGSGSGSGSGSTLKSPSTSENIDPLELARRDLGVGLVMVGDSIDDMAAGYRAGAATVLLVNEDNGYLRGHEYCDLVVERLDELVGVLEKGFVGREGY